MNSLGFDKKPKDTKIAVAMSGGVDSSVVAALLKGEGYDVFGITMRLYNQKDQVNVNKSCCAGKDIDDAVFIAKQLNIKHYILNLQEEFFNGVIDNFVENYNVGETPIPCIKCNQTVKFSDMLNEARNLKADALVTGHYVRRVGDRNNVKLFKAIDKTKDQSYFLFATTKSQLNYLRFPLGDYKKEEVRKIAKDFNLKVKNKPDSQDICFITNGSYSDFIKKIKPESYIKGNILNLKGDIIGQHDGIINYTIGQRRKIGIGGMEEPLYVININSKNNEIIVGLKNDLKKKIIKVKEINWISEKIKNNMACMAKIKSDQNPQIGKLIRLEKNEVEFKFNNSQISIAPGQACVFYNGEEVLGGGWIKKIINPN